MVRYVDRHLVDTPQAGTYFSLCTFDFSLVALTSMFNVVGPSEGLLLSESNLSMYL